jgi:hypothetical protein
MQSYDVVVLGTAAAGLTAAVGAAPVVGERIGARAQDRPLAMTVQEV